MEEVDALDIFGTLDKEDDIVESEMLTELEINETAVAELGLFDLLPPSPPHAVNSIEKKHTEKTRVINLSITNNSFK